MRKIISLALIGCLLIMLQPTFMTHAQPSVSAKSAIAIDMDTQEIIYSKNIHEQLPIASITKIMTAIVALEHKELDSKVTISNEASRMIGSSIYTQPGDVYSIEDLLYGLMLRSGNDAAYAIAEHVAGSEKGFAFLMNEKAEWIGMQNSSFQNPHGLDEDDHYSTAYDMAVLTSYAMNTSEDFREIFGTKRYLSENVGYHWMNKNKLLMTYDQVCTGGKTGYTSIAGRTLVTTAEQDGNEVVVVTIDASDDWNDHRLLYNYAFSHLEDRPEIPIFFGEEPSEPSLWERFMKSFRYLQGAI
ncbi:D-alanyl-D-alanine carboxypeptidase family protein [Alkalibacillus haloalkaliphilus]|uniref:D-alanyl-D-alanine carboxypeptidase family protein n=1 Tax=Alkalibacillus haloalkaliphilus TaxID=94136 RepID=UPI002935939F|nr:D-alanyl-D-alanine carboxypeptidase family protein [Alkalibacillus haloalkaliphilus]MDV2580865.1 D-alanyl-D-alanine carboxypeptidase family protein [Alkalibacillus haloalkaliphilus]